MGVSKRLQVTTDMTMDMKTESKKLATTVDRCSSLLLRNSSNFPGKPQFIYRVLEHQGRNSGFEVFSDDLPGIEHLLLAGKSIVVECFVDLARGSVHGELQFSTDGQTENVCICGIWMGDFNEEFAKVDGV